MAHEIKLKRQHRLQILEALAESQEYKEHRKLRNPDSIAGMTSNYNNAAAQIYNEFEPIICGRIGYKPNDNLFGWIRDQMLHSGKLAKQELGLSVIAICEAAGENRYDEFCSGGNMFSKLFD